MLSSDIVQDIKDLRAAIDKIGEVYYKDSPLDASLVECLEKYVRDANTYMLSSWLKADILDVILRVQDYDKQVKLLHEVLSLVPKQVINKHVDIDRMCKELRIRGSWKRTISNIAKCKMVESRDEAIWKVISTLEYKFSLGDFKKLAVVYRDTDRQDYRYIIEDMLTYCNFHSVCGDFRRGDFESYID